MKFGVSLLIAVLLAALGFSTSTLATCWKPQWRPATYPSLGLSVETSAKPSFSYGLDDASLLYASMDERLRDGEKVTGRCSSFSFLVKDITSGQSADPTALMNKHGRETISGRDDLKIVSNRLFTFKGSPAAEITMTFTRDMIGGTVTHRQLMVVRGDRLYEFNWYWDDAVPPPSDAVRSYSSIKFIQSVPDPNARSLALLWSTIEDYWLKTRESPRIYLSAGLRKIADPKRVAESKVVASYGWPQNAQFVRMEGRYRVFRVEHGAAVVDWYTIDNGRQIQLLTWKKVRDL